MTVPNMAFDQLNASKILNTHGLGCKGRCRKLERSIQFSGKDDTSLGGRVGIGHDVITTALDMRSRADKRFTVHGIGTTSLKSGGVKWPDHRWPMWDWGRSDCGRWTIQRTVMSRGKGEWLADWVALRCCLVCRHRPLLQSTLGESDRFA